MTASERLRTLSANLHGFHAPLAYGKLTSALPLIANVVEAAEEMFIDCHASYCEHGLSGGVDPCNCTVARHGAALTALRDALEEK